MDRGAWWATVHGIARVRHDLATKQQTQYDVGTRLSDLQTPVLNWLREVHHSMRRWGPSSRGASNLRRSGQARSGNAWEAQRATSL